ncbi:hypothetical protein BGZ65_010516, partial [Modicella reniformis]
EYQELEQTKGFKFAEVDCLIEGDICHDNNIKAYPSLLLYDNKVTQKTRSSDDSGSGANPRGEVVVLDSTNYESALKDGQPWLVEYYAPWCGHCKALAPIYENVAQALKGKVNVAKVDCPANEVVCRSQKVRGYPTIMLHLHGQATEFKDQRTLENLSGFALGATEPSIKPIKLGDLQEIKNSPDVAFVYLFDDKTSKDVTAVIEKQSQVFYEQVSIYSANDPVIVRQLSITTLPALVVLKDERQYQFPGSFSDAKAVQSWIDLVKTPLVPLLSNSGAAAALNAPGWVVLGLFDISKSSMKVARHALVETAHSYMEQLASGERQLLDGRAVRFAMLDGTKWTKYIKSALSIDVLNLPAIVAVNSQQETFYPYASDGRRVSMEKEALLQYITDMETGRLEERSMLSYAQKTFKHVSGRASAAVGFVNNHPFVSIIVPAALVYGLVKKFGGNGPESSRVDIAKAD